jgi:hypothetical protein
MSSQMAERNRQWKKIFRPTSPMRCQWDKMSSQIGKMKRQG